MLPDVGDEERGAAMGHRRVGVGRRLDLELAVRALDQPGPAAAELADCRRLEGSLEGIEAAEAVVEALLILPVGSPPLGAMLFQ